ncbi:MAG: hypothetical protein IKX20_09795 [Paludibacteraceae bacterium]|nr:hypothetical protein [Paludibacteraceae bacterium]
MKEISISASEYSSKYGLTDLYPESETKLREALASGEDFTTGWTGCRKEIRYVNYTREEGSITIEVSAHMDDLWESDDLIYDALWAACKVEEELSDEFTDRIRELLPDDIGDHTNITVVLSASATFEEIMEATGKAEKEAEQNNQEMFERLCEIVKAHWLSMKGIDLNAMESMDSKALCEGPALEL